MKIPFFCLTCMSLMLTVTPPLYVQPVFYANSVQLSQDDSVSPTRAEETKWYYRTVNGVLQKRLWSVTYGRWLTDWMDA